MAVSEGMASGCIPLIRHWNGAERIYPMQYLYGNTHDMVARVLQGLAAGYRNTIGILAVISTLRVHHIAAQVLQ